MVEAAAQGIDIVAFGEEALIGPTGCESCRAEAAACEFHLELSQTGLAPPPTTSPTWPVSTTSTCSSGCRNATHDPKVLYNTVAVIGPEGLIGTYRKIHLARCRG